MSGDYESHDKNQPNINYSKMSEEQKAPKSLDANTALHSDLDPNHINEDMEDYGLPELGEEVIKEVQDGYEAVQTFQDLWHNLMYQHREKFNKYTEMQASLSAMSFDRPETRVNFSELNELRDDIVKIEGGLETLNLYRKYVLKEPLEPWVEAEREDLRKKIKIKTNSSKSAKGKDWSKYSNWEGGIDPELNKTV